MSYGGVRFGLDIQNTKFRLEKSPTVKKKGLASLCIQYRLQYFILKLKYWQCSLEIRLDNGHKTVCPKAWHILYLNWLLFLHLQPTSLCDIYKQIFHSMVLLTYLSIYTHAYLLVKLFFSEVIEILNITLLF